MEIKCFRCECDHNEIIEDEYGRYFRCKECGEQFDITDLFIPNGTKVMYDDGCIGIVDGNDAEISVYFEEINYHVCPIEFTNEEVWSDHYLWLLREEFEVIEE